MKDLAKIVVSKLGRWKIQDDGERKERCKRQKTEWAGRFSMTVRKNKDTIDNRTNQVKNNNNKQTKQECRRCDLGDKGAIARESLRTTDLDTLSHNIILTILISEKLIHQTQETLVFDAALTSGCPHNTDLRSVVVLTI